MKKTLIIVFLMNLSNLFGQELNIKNDFGGVFSVGSRSTISAFNEIDNSTPGIGVGGQFRLQIANNLNTEWFLDYLSSNINDLLDRRDFHIGWSVMYYPINGNEKLLNPYLVAGHCFDQTFLSSSNESIARFSSAVQGGAGINLNVHPRWDITILGQYMFHLGKDIVPIYNSGSVTFQEDTKHGIEGHLLMTLGINYKIKDLW